MIDLTFLTNSAPQDPDISEQWALRVRDLSTIKNETPPPTVYGEREDGECLIYPAGIHLISGEPESGKSWLALTLASHAARETTALILDGEDLPSTAASRLALLRTPEDTWEHIIWADATSPLDADEQDHVCRLIDQGVGLIIVDSVTTWCAAHGYDPQSNTDIALAWHTFATWKRAGAAVVLIDHVTKDKESRGRWPIGAQAKLAQSDVALGLETLDPIAPGHTGRARLVVHKDRGGQLRAVCDGGTWANMVVDATVEHWVRLTLGAPSAALTGEDFRPTWYMEKISRELETAVQPLSGREIRAIIHGKNERIDEALVRLVQEGYAVSEPGARRAVRYTSLKPFRDLATTPAAPAGDDSLDF
jgi:hypothetical protein